MNILQYLLEKYHNRDWDWDAISENPNITMEIIEKYPNKPWHWGCLLYTSPSPRDLSTSRMPSSA